MQTLHYARRQLGRLSLIPRLRRRRVPSGAAPGRHKAGSCRPYRPHRGDRVLLRLLAALEWCDPETGRHSCRVAVLTRGILRQLNVPPAEASLITAAAQVHDIGKIRLPVAVLQKPEPLTAEEWALMKVHPSAGAAMLRRYRRYAPLLPVIRHHHEHWDGNGYPLGLSGASIPFGARVIAVADSFDAMTSDRPYRLALAPELARQILEEGRGRQWDPDIVDVLLLTLHNRTETLPLD